MLTYSLSGAAWTVRDKALAMRRLARAQYGEGRRGSEPAAHLIEAADEVRGLVTGRLLDRFQLQRFRPRGCWTRRRLKWGPAA